jgi:hypothetical protein
VAAFSAQGATKEGIREAAMEDYRALVESHMDAPDPSATEEQQEALNAKRSLFTQLDRVKVSPEVRWALAKKS